MFGKNVGGEMHLVCLQTEWLTLHCSLVGMLNTTVWVIELLMITQFFQ